MAQQNDAVIKICLSWYKSLKTRGFFGIVLFFRHSFVNPIPNHQNISKTAWSIRQAVHARPRNDSSNVGPSCFVFAEKRSSRITATNGSGSGGAKAGFVDESLPSFRAALALSVDCQLSFVQWNRSCFDSCLTPPSDRAVLSGEISIRKRNRANKLVKLDFADDSDKRKVVRPKIMFIHKSRFRMINNFAHAFYVYKYFSRCLIFNLAKHEPVCSSDVTVRSCEDPMLVQNRASTIVMSFWTVFLPDWNQPRVLAANCYRNAGFYYWTNSGSICGFCRVDVALMKKISLIECGKSIK